MVGTKLQRILWLLTWASKGFDGVVNIKSSLGINKPRYGDYLKLDARSNVRPMAVAA